MALAPFLTVPDLQTRKSDVNTALATQAIAAASEAIRDAAGCAITVETSTITIEGPRDRRLRLPGGPLRVVTSVAVDGQPVTDYKIVSGALWRRDGWSDYWEPSLVTVTYEHGYDQVPDDIKWLAGDLALAAMSRASEGTSQAGMASHTESIDDWSETVSYMAGTVSAVEIPEGTKQMLQARFGGGTYVLQED